eukprot:GHUV01006938.1.p1 GENE.GHUV01006938.1~~GHUV01006938.1.p1  ORF type:complete len:332 (+),score=116.06 GHUV01006938.1:212-1207(+)
MSQPAMQQLDADSVANFYSKLVDVPSHGNTDGQARDITQWQHPVQPQCAPALEHSVAAGQAVHAQQHPGAAAADGSVLFKPVKFGQPVILDPNTSMMTLPPKAATAAAPSFAAKPGAGSSARSRSYNNSSAKGHSSHLDLGHQAAGSDVRTSSTAGPVHPAHAASLGSSSKRPIERSNIGFQLLQRAGWQEGKGLGAQEQGMAAPLQAWANKGNKGLGFGPQQQQVQQGLAAQKLAASGAADAAPSAAVAGPALGTKRVAAMIEAELEAEDVDTKVKWHRQVMQQEAKDRRDKAIQEYLYRAFNETSDYGTGDCNPLGKNHRLIATNPLLD